MGRHSRAAVVMTLITITGLVAALPALIAGSAAAATRPAASAVRPAAAARADEHLVLTSSTVGATKEHVKARGVLTATGTARVAAKGGGRTTAWLVFKHGSARLVTDQASSSASVPNPATCKFTEVFRGSYQITGGTRRYAHAAGTGSYLTKFWGRLKRPKGGGCTGQLASFSQATWTWGSMSW